MSDKQTSPIQQFSAASVVDVLRGRAQIEPENTAFIYLRDGENENVILTYRDLDRQARSIAAWLQARNMAGQQVLLLYPQADGPEFLAAFFGCLYAGVVAVPLYTPRLNNKHGLARLQAVVADARAHVAFSTASGLAAMERAVTNTPGLREMAWVDSVSLAGGTEDRWRPAALTGDHLAFLQYTSGSTGNPKGVMVSHGNLLQHEEIIRRVARFGPGDVNVFWLPLFHDMGLIAGAIGPAYSGLPSVLMPPPAFLQRPYRWLAAVSKYRGSISAAPNFAYELCLRAISPEERANLDLSSWRYTISGAEPIRADTMQRFYETFMPCGLSVEGLKSAYGLAEATLMVTSRRPGQVPVYYRVSKEALARGEAEEWTPSVPDCEAVTQVGCGATVPGQRVVIADPETLEPCPPGRVGEILVQGPSVALGYLGRPEQTRETFQAFLTNGDGPFMRTGDLGFLREDGELFVAGRRKDLIIIRGRNIYPQDVEHLVEACHPALLQGAGAAFAVEVAGEEQLVVVQEVHRHHKDLDELLALIRQTVVEEYGVRLHAIQLLRQGSVPKTSSGKIQRRACRAAFLDGSLSVVAQWRDGAGAASVEAAAPPGAPGQASAGTAEVLAGIRDLLAGAAGLRPDEVDPAQPFAFYGLDSVKGIALLGDLERRLGRKLAPTLLWDYPTPDALACFLSGEAGPEPLSAGAGEGSRTRQSDEEEPIAVVGIGCRFPGADGTNGFWSLLQNGVDAIRDVPADRWDGEAFYDPEPGKPGKMNTRSGGFLRETHFDALFFGIGPDQAARMDPQHLLLAEVTWEALECAGCPVDRPENQDTGVFIGLSSYDHEAGARRRAASDLVASLFGFTGPSLDVDTACSSSLVSVHMACKSLQRGECRVAVAGGVNLILTPLLTIGFSQARMMSSTGRCHTFDAKADGYVRGEGCGVVVLKRLSDALTNRDFIHAVIRGSAINQDGRSNGLTAPNGLAQQSVIRTALERAGIEPARVGYVEAHGTGTPLGDPIELHALAAVVGKGRPAGSPCLVGSVKTQVGHLEAAAGIAGLIKSILAVREGQIPPHLHLKELNPSIDLGDGHLAIPVERQPWQGRERVAGVSSFGFGGTNCHVVLAEPPVADPAGEGSAPESGGQGILQFFTLSARSEPDLREYARSMADHLGQSPDSLTDLCFSANAGRVHLDHRLAVSVGSVEGVRQRLQAFAADGEAPDLITGRSAAGTRPGLAFLFTGQGSQYVGMGQQLYQSDPVFREALDRCDEALRPWLGQPLTELLYTAGGDSLLDQTRYTQPAIFALEYALAQMWLSWGIRPDHVMGHSLGEYVAACVAGAFSWEEGCRLVAERARLMQDLPERGAMAAVFAGEKQVAAAIGALSRGTVSIAAVNGETNTVIAGPEADVRSVVARLQAEGIAAQFLNVSHAFHSCIMDGMLDELEQLMAGAALKPLAIPLVSNLTGQVLPAGVIPGPAYWRQHTRQPVRFARGVEALAAAGCTLFLEIGPSPHLRNMVRRILPGAQCFPSITSGEENRKVVLRSLASLYVHGVTPDWEAFHASDLGRRVPLPTYPFRFRS